MHSPEFAGGLESVFGEFRRALRGFAIRPRSVPEDIAHALAEPVPEIGDDVMRDTACGTCIAAVFHQGQLGIGIPEDMVAREIDRPVKL